MSQKLALAVLMLEAALAALAADSDVQVIGEMRRMFTAHDIGANVDLAKLNKQPNLYALGALAGLRGELTMLNGQSFVSTVDGGQPKVTLDPGAKTVFLVYSSVADWRSVQIPTNVVTEKDLAAFLELQIPKKTRCAFRV